MATDVECPDPSDDPQSQADAHNGVVSDGKREGACLNMHALLPCPAVHCHESSGKAGQSLSYGRTEDRENSKHMRV